MAHASVMTPGGSFIRMKTGDIAKIEKIVVLSH
jgi:hypothetical protein